MTIRKGSKGIKYILKNQKAGSTLETGLLIAFSMLIFLLLISIVKDIFNWITDEVNSVLSFDFF